MNKKIKFSLVILTLLTISGCYNVNPIEHQNVVINSPKDNIPLISDPQKIIKQTANSTPPVKSQAIINFSGKVTLKKTNDLTAYIHKQMNEGVKDFIININSGGGDADAGIAAYQYLKQLPISITTHNIGNVQSSASLIYCSGSKRYSLPNSFFMLHGSSTHYEQAMSLEETQNLLKLGKIHLQAFVDIFKTCSNVTISQLEGYFSSANLNYFTASEAQNMGLVQEIDVPEFSKSAIFYNITD